MAHQALAQHGTGGVVVKWHQALAQHGTGAVVIMLIMAHQALAQHGTRHLPFPLSALIFVLVVAMSPQWHRAWRSIRCHRRHL